MGQEEGESKFAGFPYKPYSIQVDFMNALYHSLDKGGVSMLESPTGTGKTLSIICSAFQWVLDQRGGENLKIRDVSVVNQRSEGEGQVGCDDEPAWLRSFDLNKSNQPPEKKINQKEHVCQSEKKGKGRNQESCRDLFARGEDECSPTNKQSEKLHKKNDAEELCDDEFLLEEYESEEERALGGGNSKRKSGGISISSSSDEEGEEYETNEKEEDEEGMRVYFCSRTHSQLSQFIQELRKTVFANEIKVVCLGSRKNLCINEEVLKLGNSIRINERCLELQKNKKNETSKIKNVGAEGRRCRTKASSGCPMLRKHQLQRQFRSEASHNGALDIEDLVQLGRSVGTCPYYASRSMVLEADLVVLPYQSLLSKSSRESLGLNLKNSIVIIDEAHNLADSLISMYDAKITLSQLETVHSHIETYFGRFRNLLGPGNRRYIQTLMVITRALLQSLVEKDMDYVNTCKDAEKAAGSINAFDSSMAINDFLFSLNIDNINMIKLVQYIKKNNIIHKVSGYGDKVSRLNEGLALKDSGESSEEGSSLAGFQALVDMLLSLINKDSDGRIIISRARPTCFGQKGGYLKYVMLTGETIFSEIAGQAHAVILAGGTLQPIEETRERLFPWLPLSELHFFSCNHIVPPENILPVAVSYGPTGRSFDFSYNSRSLPTVIEELGLLLCNLVTVVPEGIVVFFSSFDYEGKVYEAWKKSGILERITKKKHVFREPRKNTDVENVLKQYKEIINTLSKRSKEDQGSQNGAILFAIVGGKISEGINFSDGMGRCIVMVGLPYPNPSDIELMERVKHIEGLGQSNSTNYSVDNQYYDGDIQAAFGILRSCKHRGKEYYENLCMKSVNQSIGRAIRHMNDYAAILLVDKRYISDSSKRSFSDPTNKLPQWIKSRLVSATNNYGEVHRLLHQFFRLNKQRLCLK